MYQVVKEYNSSYMYLYKREHALSRINHPLCLYIDRCTLRHFSESACLLVLISLRLGLRPSIYISGLGVWPYPAVIANLPRIHSGYLNDSTYGIPRWQTRTQTPPLFAKVWRNLKSNYDMHSVTDFTITLVWVLNSTWNFGERQFSELKWPVYWLSDHGIIL